MSTLAIRSKVKTLRESKGISQSQMAERLHMDERTYKRIENGEKKLLDLELLDRIAKALETDWTELVKDEGIYFENNADSMTDHGVIGYKYEMNVNNNIDKEFLARYDQLITHLNNVIAEKNHTIDLLRELKGK